MKQEIKYSEEARKNLLKGVTCLADVVSSTLGPSGNNVILDLGDGNPVATKDGVTIAKAVNLPDPIENVGAQMLKQASIKTGDEAGDGTTTATVLARNIYVQGLDSKYNSVEVKKGIDDAVKDVVSYIKKNISKPITGNEQLKQVATISANGDEEVGKLVAKALDKVGIDGAVTLEESKTGESYLEIVEGIQFDRGYKSPYFVTEENTMQAVLKDVVILLVDKRLDSIKELLSLLNTVVQSDKSLLIIAEDFGTEVLQTLLINKTRTGFRVCAVKAPEFGDKRKEVLEDIATLTGGTVVCPDKGMKLDSFNSDWFGTADKVTVGRDKTTIIGAKGDQANIEKRILDLENQIELAKGMYDKEQLRNRLARMAGGIAVINVGGHTEAEMKERKDRVDDSLHSAKAALEEGVCPGGGKALLIAASKLSEQEQTENRGWNAGYSITFIGGTSGTFYKEFGVTMAVSIIISALNALTLSPALCAILLKPSADENGKKPTLVHRFHTSFNTAYDKVLGKYKKNVQFFINHKILSFGCVIVGIVAMVILMATTKTGLVPDEDTGTLFCTVSTPPGTSLAETQKVMSQVDAMLASNPAIDSRQAITGYSFLGGQGSNQGTFIIKLKPFDERGLTEGSMAVLGMIYLQTANIKGAQILAFAPPMVPGFSATNGLTFAMQDRTGGTIDKFFGNTQKFLDALNQRPEISKAMTMFNPKYPQYMVDVDVAKCKQSGISPKVVLSTLQGYYGGLYASNFNSYGKLYRVYVQADPTTRMTPQSLDHIYTRTASGMAPVKEFSNLRKMYGPQSVDRFNLFTSISINATPADGYSSGDAINAVKEVAQQTLPSGYTYEFSGLTRSEQESSNSTALIFLLCLVFVYLILSAQYESYIPPLAVILSIPFGIAGAFLFTNIFGHDNNIYMQISLIMLIGLLAKNAILIIQFALERRQTGMAITWSAILGAGARLRPILMTSLAMIIGLLPLLWPFGVGANGNQTLGASAIGGMLIGMICQIMIVPALFVIFQYLQEKIKPIEFEGEETAAVDTELLQYTYPIELQKED